MAKKKKKVVEYQPQISNNLVYLGSKFYALPINKSLFFIRNGYVITADDLQELHDKLNEHSLEATDLSTLIYVGSKTVFSEFSRIKEADVKEVLYDKMKEAGLHPNDSVHIIFTDV